MSDHVRVSGRHPAPDMLLDLAADLLPDAERPPVLDHLKACAECEDSFRSIVMSIEQGRAAAEAGVFVAAAADRVPVPLPSRYLRWTAAAPLAAAAVLAFALIWPHASQPNLNFHTLPVPDVELRQRDASSVDDPVLTSGFEAYVLGDYARAADLLEDAAPTSELQPVRDVYLGSALAQSGRLPDARNVLESLSARTLPDPWGSEARWTLCVTYAKLGEQARADSLLTDLATESGEVGDRARNALQQRRP